MDHLRTTGRKVGLIKMRVFRPFPAEELSQALGHVKAVAVMDKSESFSACGGPLFAETCAACYDLETRPVLIDVVTAWADATWQSRTSPAYTTTCSC